MIQKDLMPNRKNNAVAFLDRLKADESFARRIRIGLASRTNSTNDSPATELVQIAAEAGFDFGTVDYLAAVSDKIALEHAAPPNMMSTCCCIHSSKTQSSQTKSLK